MIVMMIINEFEGPLNINFSEMLSEACKRAIWWPDYMQHAFFCVHYLRAFHLEIRPTIGFDLWSCFH